MLLRGPSSEYYIYSSNCAGTANRLDDAEDREPKHCMLGSSNAPILQNRNNDIHDSAPGISEKQVLRILEALNRATVGWTILTDIKHHLGLANSTTVNHHIQTRYIRFILHWQWYI